MYTQDTIVYVRILPLRPSACQTTGAGDEAVPFHLGAAIITPPELAVVLCVRGKNAKPVASSISTLLAIFLRLS
jgi:hypothetical protein